jgi:hypothetical protein
MVHQRCCSLTEDHEFFLYQFPVIIDALRPVSAHILFDPKKNIVNRTIEHDERVDRCEPGHVLRLPGMARDAVQDEQLVLRKGHSLQEKPEDLFCQGKVLIFEKKTALENAMDKRELVGRIIRGAFLCGHSAAELRSEIEMMTPSAEQPLNSNGIAQRAFADAGGAQEEDGIDWKLEGHRHC